MSKPDRKKLNALAVVAQAGSVPEESRSNVDRFLEDGRYGQIEARGEVHLGIVTALEKEFVAMLEALEAPRAGVTIRLIRFPTESTGRPRVQIKIIEYKIDDVSFRVALIQALKMGNNSAAIAATSLLYEFPELQDILMVGIAGGVPSPLSGANTDRKLRENHVRLGDIFVAADPVHQYDHVKRDGHGFRNRAMAVAISSRIQTALQQIKQRELGGEHPWEAYIAAITSKLGADWERPRPSTDRPKLYVRDPTTGLAKEVGMIKHPAKQPRRRAKIPMVHYGRIGSANTLLKDPIFRDELMVSADIRAIEMEGSGVADAAWNFAAGYGIIRGICDYCDPDKSDNWQPHAAIVAAAYSRAVIDELIAEALIQSRLRAASRPAVTP